MAVAAAYAGAAPGLPFDPRPHWYCLLLFFLVVAALERLPKTVRWRSPLLGFLVVTTALSTR